MINLGNVSIEKLQERTGCQKLENEKFVGVYKCKWNEKVEWKQEEIWKTK